MSDKNRNMNGINDQKTIDRTAQIALDQMETQAERDAFSEEIRRRLAQPGSGKPTLDEFKVMVYKDREKRRKKRNALVACLVAAFIVGFLAFDDLVPEVGADKNPKETIVTEDGVIIEDGGYGSAEEADNVWVTEDWEQVEDAKILFPKLLVPEYIPKGYKFDKLKIENFVNNDILCEYYCSNKVGDIIEIEILIIKAGEVRFQVAEITNEISCIKGTIFLQEDNKIATIQLDDGIVVNVSSLLNEADIVKVIEGLNEN